MSPRLFEVREPRAAAPAREMIGPRLMFAPGLLDETMRVNIVPAQAHAGDSVAEGASNRIPSKGDHDVKVPRRELDDVAAAGQRGLFHVAARPWVL